MAGTTAASVILIFLSISVFATSPGYGAKPYMSDIGSMLRKYLAMIQDDIRMIQGLTTGGFGNLAFGKPTKQSSTYVIKRGFWRIFSFTSDKAVDGVWESIVESYDSCTHTLKEHNPWWSVDLLRVYPVKSVVVLNRGDCCGNRFRRARVYVGNSPSSMKLCGYFMGPGRNGQRITIRLRNGTRGRYVKIVLAGKQYLQMCEVGVYSK